MPQLQLPMFPVGVTPVTALLAFIKEDGNITYFNGSLPVFSHQEEDTQSFIEQVQPLLSEHEEAPDIAAKLNIKADTLSKAIRAGRLHKPV